MKEGNLNVSVALDSKDELGQIASNFNDMTGKVRNLIAEVSEAKDKQKDAEIRALEARSTRISFIIPWTPSTGWPLKRKSTGLAACCAI